MVQAFLRCATQWVCAGMTGQRVGLNYAGVEAVLRLTVPARDRATVFAGLQTMEIAALTEFAHQADTRAARTKRSI